MIKLDRTTLAWARGVADVPVGLYVFPSEEDCMALVPSPVHEQLSAYRAGGGTFAYTFELHLRVRPEDGEARMAAAESLQAVVEAVQDRDFPEAPDGLAWVRADVTQAPSLYQAYDAGREVYRLVARLTYIERS